MIALEIIVAAVLGLVFGSFLNVCIARLPRRESVVAPRSRCPRCQHPILVRDNLPILSWALLRGRCRHCGERISVRYPLVEIAVTVLFVLCDLLYGPTLGCVAAAVLCWLLVGLFATDAETLVLPDALTLPGIAAGVLYRVIGGAMSEDRPLMNAVRSGLHSLAWAAAGALFLLLIRWAYHAARNRTGLALGDVKLFAMICAWLGLRRGALVFFLAVVGGAIYGAIRAQLRTKTTPNEPLKVPFGSFLCAATLYALLLGRGTVDWYLGLFR